MGFEGMDMNDLIKLSVGYGAKIKELEELVKHTTILRYEVDVEMVKRLGEGE